MSVSQIERSHSGTVAEVRSAPAVADRASASAERWAALKPAVSLWLAFHVLAVALYPASILVPERGLLARVRDTFFERYMEALYMVQGNRFFAPEPGPGTLIAYEIERADGSKVEQVFPRREIRPRLLYHRHFMLTERVQDVDDPEQWYWMYARHLAAAEQGERVTLTRIIHGLPTPGDIIAGKRLEDPEFYQREPIGSWTAEELWAAEPPRREPEAIAPESRDTAR